MSKCIIRLTVPKEEIVKFSLRSLLPPNIFLKEVRNNKSPIYRTVSNASTCCNTDCTQYSICTVLATANNELPVAVRNRTLLLRAHPQQTSS
jgi:hypothetical protein